MSTCTILGITTTGTTETQSKVTLGSSGQALVSAGTGTLPSFGAVGVAGGGTGQTSLAANTLLQGGSSVTASNTLAANFAASISTASTTIDIKSQHADNTSGTSNASFSAITGGASGGDPFYSATVSGVTGYSWGIDNSDSDSLKETNSNTGPSGGAVLRRMSSVGFQTLPLQPAFYSTLTATQSNQTGDGTTYTVAFDSAPLNQSTVFDTGTGTFTAPVTGNYMLCVNITTSGTALATDGLVQIVGGGAGSLGTLNLCRDLPVDTSGKSYNGSLIVPISASQTVNIAVTVSGTTKTVGVIGGNGATTFSGYLVC